MSSVQNPSLIPFSTFQPAVMRTLVKQSSGRRLVYIEPRVRPRLKAVIFCAWNTPLVRNLSHSIILVGL